MRKGSLVDGGSSGEAESSGLEVEWDKGLGEVGVEKMGQRKGLLGKRVMGVWRTGLDRG